MTHLTRFTIITEYEGVESVVVLTPAESRYVLQHCSDINHLFAYLGTLKRFLETNID